jgi:hypothetical protein
MPENDIENMSNILSENRNNVNYLPFLIHVRTICSNIVSTNNNESNDMKYDLIKQIIIASVNDKNMLTPLREWIINNANDDDNYNDNDDTKNKNDNNNGKYKNKNHDYNDNFKISVNDFIRLLKEFHIIYRPEDVVILITEFGYFPYKRNNKQNYNEKNYSRNNENYDNENENYFRNENENLNEFEFKKFLDKGFDVRQLLLKIIQGRPAWTFLYPHLAKKMKKKMIVSGADYFSLEGSKGRNAGRYMNLYQYMCI